MEEVSVYKVNEPILFKNDEHRKFFEKHLKGKGSNEHLAVAYLIGLDEILIENEHYIFDFDTNQIGINPLNRRWQTTTTKKITRLIMNLWDGFNSESEEDFCSGRISSNYAVSEIFNTENAVYFFEAIKLRYPVFFKE